jgi:integrase
MAIQIYCKRCKTSSGLDAKSCPSCGAVFGRDKKFRVCVSVKGKRVNRMVDNLTLAREAEAAIKGDLVRNEFDISVHRVQKPTTLDDVWEKYLPWAREHKKSWRDDFYHYGKHLQPRFGAKAMSAITPFDIERMKIELKQGKNQHGRPFAKATIKHQLVLLKRLFNIAINWGLFTGENPVTRVEMPKLDNQKTEYLDMDEIGRLLNVLESWPCRDTAAFIKFAMYTGLRRGELFKLTWSDVNFEQGRVTIRDPKPGKTQTIPISEEALEVLAELPRTSGFVFPGKDGKQRTDFKGPWLKIRKVAGLPSGFRFHGLRHNYASHLVSNGEDLYTVGKLLLHKHASTTQRYAHLSDGRLKEAAKKSGKLLSPKEEQENVVRLER